MSAGGRGSPLLFSRDGGNSMLERRLPVVSVRLRLGKCGGDSGRLQAKHPALAIAPRRGLTRGAALPQGGACTDLKELLLQADACLEFCRKLRFPLM